MMMGLTTHIITLRFPVSMMETVVKRFDELTPYELRDIYALRIAVFIVEQNCPFQDIDDMDDKAIHVYMKDEDGLAAYLRVLPPGSRYEDASIGRVISMRRRQGLGTKIMSLGIEIARNEFHAGRILVEAQTYARKFYETSGFRQCSEEFLEDGIPHIMMALEPSE